MTDVWPHPVFDTAFGLPADRRDHGRRQARHLHADRGRRDDGRCACSLEERRLDLAACESCVTISPPSALPAGSRIRTTAWCRRPEEYLDRSSPFALAQLASTSWRRRKCWHMALDDPLSYVRRGGSDGLTLVAPDNPVWVRFARAMAPFSIPGRQASRRIRRGNAAAAAHRARRGRRTRALRHRSGESDPGCHRDRSRLGRGALRSHARMRYAAAVHDRLHSLSRAAHSRWNGGAASTSSCWRISCITSVTTTASALLRRARIEPVCRRTPLGCRVRS